MPLARSSIHQHMKPQVIQDVFIEYEMWGDTYFAPSEVATTLDDDCKIVEVWYGKWWARLSAPGYTDCTDWAGPYDDEAKALWYLYETYGDTEDETFFNFIGWVHNIEPGTLDVRGDHLWGTVLGEKHWKDPRLVHIGQSNGLNRQEWDDDEGNTGFDDIEGDVINDDEWKWLRRDLEQAWNFVVPDEEGAKSNLAFIRRAQGVTDDEEV